MLFITVVLPLATLIGLSAAVPTPDNIVNAREVLDERAATRCRPNFQGANLYIKSYNYNNNWWTWHSDPQNADYVSTLRTSTNTWRIEGSGSPNNDFIIKKGGVPDNSVLVKPYQAQDVALGTVKGTGNPTYTVSCEWCADPGQWPSSGKSMAKGCFIVDTSTGYYLTEVPSSTKEGGYLNRFPKNGKTNQYWNMSVA